MGIPIFVALLLTTLMPADAQAREGFGIFDTDRDGALSREEYGGLGWSFGEFDGNADGLIDEREYSAFAERGWGGENEQTAWIFDEWDEDGDRLLSRNEWADDEGFSTRDTDRNGILDEDEGLF